MSVFGTVCTALAAFAALVTILYARQTVKFSWQPVRNRLRQALVGMDLEKCMAYLEATSESDVASKVQAARAEIDQRVWELDRVQPESENGCPSLTG